MIYHQKKYIDQNILLKIFFKLSITDKVFLACCKRIMQSELNPSFLVIVIINNKIYKKKQILIVLCDSIFLKININNFKNLKKERKF